MSTLTEQPTQAPKNPQATACLVLGIIALVVTPFNLLPGILSSIGCIGPVATLLAVVAGVRALRAARAIGGKGRISALVGMGIGSLGMIVFLLFLVLSAWKPVAQMNTAISTYEAKSTPQTFTGGGLKLTYSDSWQTFDLNEQEMCQSSGTTCLLGLTHTAMDGTNVILAKMDLGQAFSLEEVDQGIWSELESSTPGITLESRQVIEVGGGSAIQRIFMMPSQSGETAKIMQVYIIEGQILYLINYTAPGADTFAQHQDEVGAVISSITFEP